MSAGWEPDAFIWRVIRERAVPHISSEVQSFRSEAEAEAFAAQLRNGEPDPAWSFRVEGPIGVVFAPR